MENIKDCTKKLITAILESSEYKHFAEIRDQVKENPELHKQINDFRQHVFNVQNSSEPLDMYAEEERLSKEYEEFRKDTLVNEFLLSELRVCRILQKITADIADSVDLDTEDVSKQIGV